MKKDPSKLDMADGVPHMRGLNRKQAIERNYREKEGLENGNGKHKDKKKNKDKTGMNEKVVDCMYVGLMCCECSIQ